MRANVDSGAAQHDARARQDRVLLLRCRDGDAAAREALVERFLPLARQLARRYRRGGEPLDDLYQVASLGLLKAIDRFDVRRETAFSTFAVPTILGELKRHFRDKTWLVRVPRDLQELAIKLDAVSSTIASELGRIPTAAELAAATGHPVEDVLEAREALSAHTPVSLDRPREDDEHGDETLADTIGIEEDGYATAESAATLQQLLRVLSDRDREILRLRFQEDLTQSEIGARLDISQMHVSRLIRQSIVTVREAAEQAQTADDVGADHVGAPQPRRATAR